MSETTIVIVAVIVAGLIGFALGRARGREATGEGRLTFESHPAPPTATVSVAPSSTTPTIADFVESALETMPELQASAQQPGVHVSIKTNVTRVFKLQSQDLANAVAERERAKGMTVVVTPPDATDSTWRVTSTN